MSESSEDDKEQKTEEPSQRRLEQALERGQVPVSKEVANFVFILGCFVITLYIVPYSFKKILKLLIPFIHMPHDIKLENGFLKNLFIKVTLDALPYLAISLIFLCILLIAVGFLQVGKGLSLQTLKPKFDRLSPSKNIKKIFSIKALIEFSKTLVKTFIVFYAFWFVIKKHDKDIPHWIGLSYHQVLNTFENLIFKLFFILLIILFFMGGLDYIYQRYSFIKNLRMTKQEVKEEHKDIEGNPAIKQRIRQIRFERSRKRMMQDVPSATVVITNPTHYAVALKWDESTMNAPQVIAKGQDHLALKIREIAKENDIPIIENPPVARALYDQVELKQEIPPTYYKAVADIIRLVMEFKNRRF